MWDGALVITLVLFRYWGNENTCKPLYLYQWWPWPSLYDRHRSVTDLDVSTGHWYGN